MFVMVMEKKHYGFWKFLFDCIMVVFTGGFWLIWIFVRELRRNRSVACI